VTAFQSTTFHNKLQNHKTQAYVKLQSRGTQICILCPVRLELQTHLLNYVFCVPELILRTIIRQTIFKYFAPEQLGSTSLNDKSMLPPRAFKPGGMSVRLAARIQFQPHHLNNGDLNDLALLCEGYSLSSIPAASATVPFTVKHNIYSPVISIRPSAAQRVQTQACTRGIPAR
jgi:hypothetical protein